MRTPIRILVSALLGGLFVAFPTSPAYAKKCEYGAKLNDVDFREASWGQKHMDVKDRVWPHATGKGVTVAVIDSGVWDGHEVFDQKDKISYGTSFPDDGMNAKCDRVGHGTVIAGVIAGKQDGDGQFHGMAPDARIHAIRLLPDTSPTSDPEVSDLLAEAVDEAVDKNGVKIINVSVAVGDSAKLEAAVKRAHDKGVLIVAAGGNQNGDGGGNEPVYPAAYGQDGDTDVSVLAVAGMKQNGERAEKSNTGEYIDVAGPGENVNGPSPRTADEYNGGNGTSYATPFVSGTAALVMQRYPDLGPAEVARRITATAEHPPGGRDDAVGYGMVDPYRAVTADLGKDAEHVRAAPPRLQWPGDTEHFARNAAGVMLLGTVVVILAVITGRTVIPRIRRNRE